MGAAHPADDDETRAGAGVVVTATATGGAGGVERPAPGPGRSRLRVPLLAAGMVIVAWVAAGGPGGWPGQEALAQPAPTQEAPDQQSARDAGAALETAQGPAGSEPLTDPPTGPSPPVEPSPLLAAPVPKELTVEAPSVALTGVAPRVKITLGEGFGGPEVVGMVPVSLAVDGRQLRVFELAPGEHELLVEEARLTGGRREIQVAAGGATAAATVRVIPGWLSVVPPLVAIGLALLFKDVLVSLFLGVFVGALILQAWRPVAAFARSIDQFILPALADADHAKIVVFTTLLGGMVGVISRSGGTRGIVEALTPLATSSRRGQLATWLLGVAIFFDDYANTLIVGSTMRPITDRLRISREKLAYIVDSTAAPVASVVPISTWIGFEVGLIAAAFTQVGIEWNAFSAFVASIPYRFYPLLALVFGFSIAASGRDFGPMLAAERRAARGELLAPGDRALAEYRSDALEPAAGTPLRAINAVLPILTVIGVTLAGLYVTGAASVAAMADAPARGTGAWWREVFAQANSFDTLLWASLAGLVMALALPLVQRILPLTAGMEAMVEGFKAMLLALVVLVLAWSIGAVCGELHTADYLVQLTQGVLSPHWLPVLVFVLSAAVAFATGTSWGTMGILIPLVIPIAHGLATANGLALGDGVYGTILLGTISSVLAGSVWGDHCSPISDTTILSSTASGSDHIAHVRTQLPYALGVGVVGMLVGDIPTAYGMSPWVSLAVGSAVLIGGIYWLGRKS
ncbi:MAG TPA: Na+/H+ antiporter NhaC family protein [Thermoanaerobaculia bacterium]|nr:Na+/H+ antiporter NhaC family protein [Thermoanaerobaculia bacterium]